jgi:hypothetical protein
VVTHLEQLAVLVVTALLLQYQARLLLTLVAAVVVAEVALRLVVLAVAVQARKVVEAVMVA